MEINQIKKELEALEVQMISVLHLLWIIPICIVIGWLGTLFFVSATSSNKESAIYDEGIREGQRRALLKFEEKNND